MRLEVNINKQDIFNEVSKESSYSASRSVDAEGNSLYDSIWVSEAEYEMLDSYYKESCIELTLVLSEWVMSDRHNGDAYAIELKLSNTFNDSLVASLKESISRFLELSTLAKWYMLTNKTEAESTMLKASAQIDSIKRIINSRKRPVRDEDRGCEMWCMA